MKWMVVISALLILFAFNGEGMADQAPFTGSVGLEAIFRPADDPVDRSVQIGLDLGFSIADFELKSSTLFDLVGFYRQIFTTTIDLGFAAISNKLTFQRPGRFTRNDLAVDLSIMNIDFGIDLILADIAFPQTPNFNIGMVIDIRSQLPIGSTITSLTGFGVRDLEHILDDKPVTVVAGFAFEEQLTRIAIDYLGIRAAAMTIFDRAGLQKAAIEFGYHHTNPHDELTFSLMMATDFDRTLAITGMRFDLGATIARINFRSRTEFAPLAFSRQTFTISSSIAAIDITSRTVFTAPFTFDSQRITIVTEVEPVKFTTCTRFDRHGFAAMEIKVGLTISGIHLYTSAAFDFRAITEVVVGFQLTF